MIKVLAAEGAGCHLWCGYVDNRLHPRVTRHWTRDTPCPGHTTCFTGTKAGAVTVKVCAAPIGSKGRHAIESRRIPVGTHTVGMTS